MYRFCLSWFPAVALVLSLGTVHACAQDKSRPSVPAVDINTKHLSTVTTFASKSGDTVKNWYPKIVAILGMPAPQKAGTINIRYDMGMDGVAETGGDGIRVSARYVAEHPDDMGMIVHELCHVLQAYPKYDPVWLVEGIADYVRFYHYEPVEKRPHPNPDKANCRDSYRTTGAFLDWACRTYDAKLIQKLDAALKAGTYSEDMFAKATGKSLDTLNAEWLASLKAASSKQ